MKYPISWLWEHKFLIVFCLMLFFIVLFSIQTVTKNTLKLKLELLDKTIQQKDIYIEQLESIKSMQKIIKEVKEIKKDGELKELPN